MVSCFKISIYENDKLTNYYNLRVTTEACTKSSESLESHLNLLREIRETLTREVAF